MLADYIEISVPSSLHSYILHTTGGDTIHPGKNGVLWAVIKQHLICYTSWMKEVGGNAHPSGQKIKIELLRKNGAHVPGKEISINTSSRKYISLKGSRIIVRLLISEFQKTFLDYMAGATMANPQLNIKDTINIFCDDYGLDFLRDYEMLKKRWYRFRMRPPSEQNSLLNM